MSAAWEDYDNDGRLDLYVGNMWSSAGQRITSLRQFESQRPDEEVRSYRRHAKGNSLFANRGGRHFRGSRRAGGRRVGDVGPGAAIFSTSTTTVTKTCTW